MSKEEFDIKTWLLDHLEELTDTIHGKNFNTISKQNQADLCGSVVTIEQIVKSTK